jgi:hypothetical protein
MSDTLPSDEYDDDVRGWLAPLHAGEALPDREFLRGLRERSAEEFLRSSDAEAAIAAAPAPLIHPDSLREINSTSRRTWRPLGWAAAACAAAIAAWLGGELGPAARGGDTLGDVLRRTVAARSLHLVVNRMGWQAEVWVDDANHIRWEDAPGKYAIARGSQLWRIDEAENVAARGQSSWVNKEGVDLVALLEEGGNFQLTGIDDWLTTEQTGQSEYLGEPCAAYERTFDTDKGLVRVVAYADLDRQRLQGLAAWLPGASRAAPLAELRLVARDVPVDEEKFVVAESLTEDGRIGKVTDVQGLVALQPPLAARWTPVCGPLVLKPGDWVRTETRGANAVRLALSSQAELTLGPGGLIELESPNRIRVHAGELQVKLPAGSGKSITLLGAGDQREELRYGEERVAVVFRRRDADAQLVKVKNTPQWLAGFEGSTSDESLGSLIATVDGRSVPLSVGYHKVTVDIRDQIARTVVEESFVNHSNGRLEGVFYFPLPADASISGFGMWIGNELVEADVVEKQRAREIYETILRERRDPGLLEWTSGNLFKARVFPIEANSEKRVKIVYTQVLPLRDNRYVYSYGLRSELLRTRPLRELSIDVRVASELPLRSVMSPTHDVRVEQTAHAADVQFAAQEYAPTRDFEVACEIDRRQSDVVVIPHQRGEDGYFLVQLTPPTNAGNLRRETLGEGDPLEVMLLCDTSASMDSESRRQQREFVESVLRSLGPGDRFNLATCDVDCRWALEGMPRDEGRESSGEATAPATDENVSRALAFLDGRRSLGWTDLATTFGAVLPRVGEKTRVIYVGDGMPSAGDAVPQALVARLRRMYDDRPRGTFHAVGVGNLYEATVLKAIGRLGGGSQRHISGEASPQRVALELLREMTEPGLRDLKVEFSGVQVAAVYPEVLPNLPAGAQQILVGRYLPGDQEQSGELIVTGRRGDETVRYATTVWFPADDQETSDSLPLAGRAGEGVEAGTRTDMSTGDPTPPLSPPRRGEGNREDRKSAAQTNSFIPRLWARSHLDQLLAQGASQAIQDEIIALSEQFHIITPFTSLLVLETDADRARFGVKRRFAMRDGERFFADGRDNASYELVQQQMREAAEWRQGLRQQALMGMSGLGRSVEIFRQAELLGVRERSAEGLFLGYGMLSESASFRSSGPWSGSDGFDRRMPFGGGGGMGGLSGAAGWDNFGDFNGRGFPSMQSTLSTVTVPDSGTILLGGVKRLSDISGPALRNWSDVASRRSRELSSFEETAQVWDGRRALNSLAEMDVAKRRASWITGGAEFPSLMTASSPAAASEFYAGARISLGQTWYDREHSVSADKWQLGLALASPIGLQGLINSPDATAREAWAGRDTQWLDAIVPALPAPLRSASKLPTEGWPAEAIEISKGLLRVEELWALKGGIELRRVSESFDPRWERTSGHSETLELYSPKAWLTRPLGEGVHTVVHWRDADERGVFSRAFELGRVRAATADERREIPLGVGEDSLQSLHEVYAGWNVKVERPAKGRVVLVLTPKHNARQEMRLSIDAERHVLLERQQLADGKVIATTTFSDFTQVADTWWARRSETRDAEGALTARVTQSVQLIAADEFDDRFDKECPSRAESRGAPTLPRPAPALLVHFPLPTLQRAKEAVVGSPASVEAQLVVLLDHVARQEWDAALARMAAIEKLAPQGDAPAWSGLKWVRTALEQLARRNATVLERLTRDSEQLVEHDHADRLFLANHVLGVVAALADANEQLRLADALRSVYSEQPEHVGGLQQWQQRRVDLLHSLGRTEERLTLHRELAAAVPWDAWRQIAYARDLASGGQHDAAYAWIRQQLDRNPRRVEDEKNQLVFAYADMLNGQGRYADEADWLAERVAQQPDSQEVYDRYLSALVFADRLPRAEGVAAKWLRIADDKAVADAPLAPNELAKLQAAVNYALGQRRNISVQRPEDNWLAPLAAAVRQLATQKHHANIAGQILSDWRFSDSDEADAVRGDLFARLKAEVDSLAPNQLSAIIGWTISSPPETSSGDWRVIADSIRQRWSRAADIAEKDALSQPLVAIYAARFADGEYLPFLRARLDVADEKYRTSYVSALFEALLGRPWSDELEREAFDLLAQLSEAKDAVDRLAVELPALYRLVDAMIRLRVEHDQRDLQATGHSEKLTRTELAAKEAGFLQAAREGVASRLDMPLDGRNADLAKWFRIERLTLDVHLDRNLDNVARQCWEILGEAPDADAGVSGGDEASTHEIDMVKASHEARAALLIGVARSRALAIATFLAVREDAKPQLVERLLRFIDAGVAHAGPAAESWRGAKFDLLVALDRPDDLERELQAWIADGGTVSPWRAPLGRLLAERGKLREAIGVFEAVRTNDNLSPSDLATLARWYQVEDRRADYEKTAVDAYMAAEEWTLLQMIEGNLYLWRRTDVPLPTELDPQVLLVFEALFRKSTSPGDYAGLLRDFYQACRDFRLLRMVPEALLGRTQQEVYPFLRSLNLQVLGEVRDEAVTDELLARISELRERELTPLDRRALDLLEAMVERKAAEVLNQPGPHVAAAKAALQRAFRDEWADGERFQMAQLLAEFGAISAPELAAEQVRQLRELHAEAEAGSVERVRIAAWHAHALFWSYGKHDEALAVLEGAVGEFRRARKNAWPEDATEPLESYVTMLENRSRFAEAESLLLELAETPATPSMANWLAARVDRTYLAALDGDGQTTLGRGIELYDAIVQHVDGELDNADASHRAQLISQLLEVFAHAHAKAALADAAKRDLRRFAFDRLPGLLAKQTSDYETIVDQTADRVKELLGPVTGINFLVERLKAYPPWLEMSWQNGWQRHSWRLGQWRYEAGADLGDAEAGLLRVVLRELRRDLRSRESRSRYLYHDDNQYFWSEKRDVFAATAREELAERRESGRAVKHIAEYLYHGLELHGEAIAALFVVHRAGKLDDGGQQQLVTYLHWSERFEESIAILEPLVEKRPDEMLYRTELMIAYFRTDRLGQLREMRAATDEYFSSGGRWTQGAMAALAEACRATQLYELAVGYYKEAIEDAERQVPSRGVGGSELPTYYRGLAESYSGLGQTENAVDAAAGAVVSWGLRSDQQQAALDVMRQVLRAASDLDAYARTLDGKAEETEADSPLIRKLLGEVLLEKGQHAAAETQLRAALALAPTDLGAHELLVKCLDTQQKSDAAAEALLAWIDVDRRNLTLLGQLADRLAGDEAEAERAATSIVEASPQEAENHAALAELRQKHDRWAEAIDQWRHVARLRTKEPDGLLKLAAAQVHERKWDDAEATVQTLRRTAWPARFGDLSGQLQELERQIAVGQE